MEEAVKKQEIERLLHTQQIRVIEKPNAKAFICVYSSEEVRNGFHSYCFLLPQKDATRFFSALGWDLRSTDFRPHVECVEHWKTGEKVREVFYLRDGNETGAQALVHERYFANLKPPGLEIAEEFRLFHNLYHDTSRDIFIHCDVNGVEHEVARISPGRVEVHLRFLTDFLRAKQMHLALQWDGAYWSKHSLEELGLKSECKEQRGTHFWWELSVRADIPDDEYKCIARLIGKAIIPCPGTIEYHDPYEEDHDSYPSFIIGHNEDGTAVVQSCSPESLKAGASIELRPVFFRRSVLAKYYAEPIKFSVEDGHLRCGGLWGLRMDNDHPKYVIVFLKDLGTDLPAADREHWRSFNVSPDGGMSETFYTRNIRAWFASPKMPDLQLKHYYPRVNKLWEKAYGWPLWKQPADEDLYVFTQAHVCLEDNQPEFDQQNGLLTKLLNDFINEEKIKAGLKNQPQNPGSLNLLEQFLLEAGFNDAKLRIKPLRVLQSLRSGGAAHAKGKNYTKALKESGLNGLPLIEASMKIFTGVVEFIGWLKVDVLKSNE